MVNAPYIKYSIAAVLLLMVCFGLGWAVGQGSLVASVERAYIAMFDSMTRDNSRVGEYYVVYSELGSLREELSQLVGSEAAAVEPTDVPGTAKIVFSQPSAANFDTVGNLDSVRLVLGSVLPFMCH